MRLAGCILVLCIFTSMGMHASSRLGKRVRQLKGLEKAIVSMQREIDYQLSPLSYTMLHTAKRSGFPWNLLFLGIGEGLSKRQDGDFGLNELFEEEIKKIRIYHPWEKDMDILLSLGKGMGELDKRMQLAQLSIAEEEVRLALKNAGEEQKQKGKLYQTLGVCMGILGAILLI